MAQANAKRAERDLSHRLLDRVFAGNLAALNRQGREEVMERIVSVQRLRRLFAGQAGFARIDLAFSALFIMIIWALAGPLALVPITMIVCVGLLARRMRRAHRAAVEKREDNDRRRMSFLIEVLRQIRLVKLVGGEQRMLRRYEMLHSSSAEANETLIRISDISFTTSAMLGQAATGLTSLFGAYLVMQEAIGLADLAASILLTGRTVQPVVQAFFLDGEMNYARQTNENLAKLMEVEDQRSREIAPDDAAEAAMRFVGLGLPSGLPDGAVFRVPDLSIPAGSLVSVDADECGDASVLLRCLGGELDPRLGSIGFGAEFGESLDRGGGLDFVYVPRRPELFDGTYLENLTGFRGRRKQSELLRTGRDLDLETELALLPGDLDCRFDGRGRGPGSPGLYKKLSLVSALALRPRLLLLDQPFADLDPMSAARVRDQILALRGVCTAFLTGRVRNWKSAAISSCACLPARMRRSSPVPRQAQSRRGALPMGPVQKPGLPAGPGQHECP